MWTGANLPGRGGPFFAAFAPPSGGLKPTTAQTRQREGPRGREGSVIAHSAPFFFLPIESFDTVFSELRHPKMGSSNHKRNRSCQVDRATCRPQVQIRTREWLSHGPFFLPAPGSGGVLPLPLTVSPNTSSVVVRPFRAAIAALYDMLSLHESHTQPSSI